MFQKSNKSDEAINSSINLIGSGTQIVGDITSNGDARIDGVLKGNISISGKLVVGQSGSIEGNVQCQNADISGEINGKLNVSELLSLKASAKIIGDIVTGKISIEPNATFTGTCNMGAVVKNIQNNASATAEKTSKTA
ncbi:MAG: polymer-forming cytoskeletal protein [Bacteroidia bacterium]|nr:polymer-forming cytoskeletal protein [Bacteroidia bacterium]